MISQRPLGGDHLLPPAVVRSGGLQSAELFRSAGAVPVVFVRAQLQSAISQGVLTIGELFALPSVRLALATIFRETIAPTPVAGMGGSQHPLLALIAGCGTHLASNILLRGETKLAQQSTADKYAITGFRAWRIKEPDSARRYTVVRLESGGGTVGYGEGGPTQATAIAEAKAAVLGRRATQTEFIRSALASTPEMEAAVNNALLDLMGKAAGVPIYQYLGGPTRYKARVLARLEGTTLDSVVESMKRAGALGFRAFAVPIPARDKTMWRMQDYVDSVRRYLEHLRDAGGPGAELVLDAAGSLTPGDAAFIATALERFHLIWLDEPTDILTNDGLAKITEESVMPVGIGRTIHDVSMFQNLLRWQLIDLIRPSLGLNSIAKIRRMAAIAETHYIAVAPYHAGGPIATVTAIHLAASLPNSFIQQIPMPASERDRAMRAELTSGNQESAKDGFAALINKPGLGIAVNESALNQYSEETI